MAAGFDGYPKASALQPRGDDLALLVLENELATVAKSGLIFDHGLNFDQFTIQQEIQLYGLA
jgi:hypothetical protein